MKVEKKASIADNEVKKELPLKDLKNVSSGADSNLVWCQRCSHLVYAIKGHCIYCKSKLTTPLKH